MPKPKTRPAAARKRAQRLQEAAANRRRPAPARSQPQEAEPPKRDEPLLTGILAGVHREQRPYLDDATIEAAERMRRRYGGYDE